MSTGSQKPKRGGRIRGLFNRTDTSTVQEQSGPQNVISASYDDKERTRARYLKAASLLEDALKDGNDKRGGFEIPNFEGEFENTNPEEFRRKLEELCQLYSAKRNRNWVEKCAHVLRRCFTAFAPFAKNFLAIAKEGAQVCSLKIYFPDH